MHDKALIELGKIELEKYKNSGPADVFIEHPFSQGEFYALLLVYKFHKDQDGVWHLEFERHSLEKFNDDNYKKLAYKKGASKGGDITFTTKFSVGKKHEETQDNIRKKFEAIVNRLKKFSEFYRDNYEEGKYFDMILNDITQNRKKIEEYVLEVANKLDKKVTKKLLLSLKVVIEGNEKYLYDFNVIRDFIEHTGIESKYYMASIGESRAKDKVCSVTQQKKDEVYGLAAPLTYATVDKPGMVAGFFRQKDNWRNYPVSREAALLLELGKNYLLRELSSWFYVSNYAALPNPILQTRPELYKNLVRRLKTAFAEERAKKEAKARAEDYVMKKIAEEKNYFTVDLIFYEQKQSAFRIIKYIEEILPSRFRLLFVDVPAKINRREMFKEALMVKKKDKKQKGSSKEPLIFSYGILRSLFNDKFLDVVQDAFLGKPLLKEFVFDYFMNSYRTNMNNAKSGKAHDVPYNFVNKAIMAYLYFIELGLLNFNKNFRYMEPTEKNTKSFLLDEFNKFVKENPEFFDSELKVGLFALGVLIKYVMDLQYSSLKNTPFEKKLHGYHLSPELVQSLYTDALAKLSQYTSAYAYNDLRNIIAEKLVVNYPHLRSLSNNELSFYVVAGIELATKFKNREN